MVDFLAGVSGRSVARHVTEYRRGQELVLTPFLGGTGKTVPAIDRRPEHVSVKDLATCLKVSTWHLQAKLV